MSQVHSIPKLVKKELIRLLEFCSSMPYDSLRDIEDNLETLLENIDIAKEEGYINFKN